jgi:hypothetical protein
MTLDQLRTFASSSDQSIIKIALTKDAARALIREHDREVNAASNDPALFEPKDRDDSAFIAGQFAKIHQVQADETRLYEATGLRTTAFEAEQAR